MRASSCDAARSSCRSETSKASSRPMRARWTCTNGVAPTFRAARTSAIVISSGTSKASIKTFSLRLSRVEYSTRSFASLSKRASCIERYDSIESAGCNRAPNNLINPFGENGQLARRRNCPEKEWNVSLPPTARSTSAEECPEQRPHFPRVQGCTCCKREFRRASITEIQRAQFESVAFASGQSPLVSSASEHQPDVASRRYYCKEHQPGFDRTVLPRESLVELQISSSHDKRFFQFEH